MQVLGSSAPRSSAMFGRCAAGDARAGGPPLNSPRHVGINLPRAFTLLELLTSIAIIMLLVALVAMSLRGVQASASRSESLNALKQMTLAYNQYADEHRKRLMPGYIDLDVLNQLAITAELPDGTVLDQCAGDICDASSYIWRLAPYVDNAWETFFTDTGDTGLLSQLHAEFDNDIYGPSGSSAFDGGISERPTYGMNSIFVGGDSVHGGTYATDRNPWTGSLDKIAGTRLSEVKNPSRLIVFAPTFMAGTDDLRLGFCELRPPYLILDDPSPSGQWIEPQWIVGSGGMVEQTSTGQYTAGAGLPIARAGKDLMPVAHLDGSATVEEISDLSRDMRRWDPFEVARRLTQPPPP